MTSYCDTSLVVALLVAERHSDIAREWLGRQDAVSLAISGWVSAEVASALAQKQRMKSLSGQDRARTQRVWSTAFAARVTKVDVRPEDFERAATLVDAGQRGLRAADALHLAIAERNGFAMATLDDDLQNAAAAIGLDAPNLRADS